MAPIEWTERPSLPVDAMKKRRNAACSFCRKSYQDVGPLVEGPGSVYICGECVELCQTIFDQEKRRRQRPAEAAPSAPALREQLDRLIDGQEEAKDALILAARCRLESSAHEPVLLLGPARSSKALLARALAHVLAVPFAQGEVGLVPDPITPLLHELLSHCDFDIEAAQRGVVYLDGVAGPGALQSLRELVDERLGLDVGGLLFVCGSKLAPSAVGNFQAIAQVSPLDEATLTRLVMAVDFGGITG